MYGPYIGKPTFLFFPGIVRPKSRGWLKLKSRDPFEHPIFSANYYQHNDDIKVMIDAIKIAYKLGSMPPFDAISAKLMTTLVPGCEQYEWDLFPSDEYIECMARTLSMSGWHQAGSCRYL